MYSRIISESFDPVSLLSIRIAGSTAASTFRLTNMGEEVEFGGNDYTPMSFARSEIRDILSSGSEDAESIQITFANVDGQLGEFVATREFDGAECTLYEHDRRLLLKDMEDSSTRTRDAILLTQGQARNITVSERTVTFDIVGVLGQLRPLIVPRRLYQKNCNFTFGSESCGADITVSPNQISATVLSGTTKDYVRVGSAVTTAAGNPANPTEYWGNGHIRVVDGDAATQMRPINRVQTGGGQIRFYVSTPFLVKPAPGDTILIRRGCPKTKAGCTERQGNTDPYGGFEEVPLGELRPTKPVKGYD